MMFLTQVATVILALSTTQCLADDKFGILLWQAGQFEIRGKTKWQMPEIDVQQARDGQLGMLRHRNEHGNYTYVVADVIDEWTVVIGADVPRFMEGISSATVGSVQSTRGNLLKVAKPYIPEIDIRFNCRMPTKGLSKDMQFVPDKLFRVSGSRSYRNEQLQELELVFAPYQRQALVYVNYQLQSSRYWTDSTGSFRVLAKLVGKTENTVQLQKGNSQVIEIERSKLSKHDLDFLDRKQSELESFLGSIVSSAYQGSVRDDEYEHVYGFKELTSLEAYWKTKPLNAELSSHERERYGITLIPTGTMVEVSRTHTFTDDANSVGVAIEVSPIGGELNSKVLYVVSFDFSTESGWLDTKSISTDIPVK